VRAAAPLARGVVDEFDVHRREEALSNGVVPAVAHAADYPMLRQQPLVVAARVLTAGDPTSSGTSTGSAVTASAAAMTG
jgi:hypothetical protein